MTAAALGGALALCAFAALAGAEEPTSAARSKFQAPKGMALIPSGEFTMGRTRTTSDDETGMRPLVLRDDRPARRVRIDAFFMDVRETTHAEYAEFVRATGRRPPHHWQGGEMPANLADTPVYNVDWEDASAYCAWAGKRLPTEAEWEKAARGGLEGVDYPWGDEKPSDAVARFNTPKGPAPVGARKPNPYGLYDMAGNMAEWCSDWFLRTYYELGENDNPRGPETGNYRVIRGGAWSDGPRRITVFFRNWVRPNTKTPNIGFRCVRDVGEPAR